jgi:hypothetical protein
MLILHCGFYLLHNSTWAVSDKMETSMCLQLRKWADGSHNQICFRLLSQQVQVVLLVSSE